MTEPLVPADLDLRDFPNMLFDVMLRGLSVIASGDEYSRGDPLVVRRLVHQMR
jgi:hypothetical protein